MFSCEFCEISKSTFFTEHVRATASRGIPNLYLDRINHISSFEVLLIAPVKEKQGLHCVDSVFHEISHYIIFFVNDILQSRYRLANNL